MQTSTTTQACEQAQQALAQRDAAAAMALLQPTLAGEPSAPVLALLGAAHYLAEQYEPAAQHYAQALALQPGQADWQHMQALAQANVTAAVHQYVPDLHYFDRATLLAAPARSGLPAPLASPPAPGLLQRIRIALGNALGDASSSLMHHVTHGFVRLAGYRDAVWTNWYRRGVSMGILTLAYMRDQLNARNLQSSYPAGALTAFQPAGLTPPPGVTHFRTADGSWNNLADPKEGAAGTRFLRNVKTDVMHAEVGQRLLTPNPRVISRTLFARPVDPKTGLPVMKEVPFLNLLAAAWIQFMNGDWINHGDIHFTDVIEVPLPDDDPARARYWQTKMFIGRTQADPTRQPQGEQAPTSSINEVTHWWDGSQIYGSDQATQDRLRSGVDGKLHLTEDQRLPLDGKGIEQTGFTRNWWLGMALLHTLFAREHNAICDELKAHFPAWDDNRLFNVARLVNAAVMAKIHTVEWTPAILPNATLNIGINGNWYGVLTNLLRKPADRKTVADINVRDPVLGGVVGNPIEKHNVAYGLSEEFAEIYRLHSLLPETLKLQRGLGANTGAGAADELPFSATRQSGSAKLTGRYAMADLLHSFGNQNPGQLVLHNYPRFMQELSIPGNPFFDMGTVDILRARERGVPRYNEFRRQLFLAPIRRFEDLTDDADIVSQLKLVYGDQADAVEDLDLLVGTLSEGHRPTNFGFGETMFQIFLLNATRRLQADRFFTDCYSEEFYTEPGLRWVDRADFKTVLLRHHPELAATGLANIRNAFEPWDIEAQLDPARHPLRACDSALKGDPWRGDAHRQQG